MKIINSLREFGEGRRATGSEVRYNCPYCGEGKKKFYYNTTKKTGECKKCGEVVKFKEEKVFVSDNLINIYNDFKKISSEVKEVQIRNKIQETKKGKITAYNMKRVFSLEDSLSGKYLKERGISEELLCYWDVGTLKVGEIERVFLPDKVFSHNGQRYTNFYQTRQLHNYGTRYDMPSIKKPLMKLWKHNFDRLFFAEGIFSAIAIGKEAIPLLGKSMTDNYLSQLEIKYVNRKPKKIFICLDGGCEKQADKVYNKIKDFFSLESKIYRIDLPVIEKEGKLVGLDPDDVKEDIEDYIQNAIRLN